jgi:hypothetical protein
MQIHLPVRYGGFGITSALETRSLAFLSSVIAVIRLSPKDGDTVRNRLEKVLYHPQQHLPTEGSHTLIGSIMSRSKCHAGDFLSLKNQYAEVTGSPQPMPRDTPLGSPQAAPSAQRSPISTICSTSADPSQWPQDSVSMARHNNIRDTLAWLGKLAGTLVTVEPHEYSSLMGSPNLRPDILFRTTGISRPGSVVAVDVTVTHPVSSNSKTQPGGGQSQCAANTAAGTYVTTPSSLGAPSN